MTFSPPEITSLTDGTITDTAADDGDLTVSGTITATDGSREYTLTSQDPVAQEIFTFIARDDGGRASEVLSLTITISGATDVLPIDPGGNGDFSSAIHDII